eukprot:TRINITY_DN389_c0_g1_i2.p1 TRINITY_DN389_c0_g1~~TRINITY_DN389_c0_g1_i2.p1  ORF type:complete len:471 (-),score=134.48 TRINITY_DN389_c0_g1_i2:95-1507(-)
MAAATGSTSFTASLGSEITREEASSFENSPTFRPKETDDFSSAWQAPTTNENTFATEQGSGATLKVGTFTSPYLLEPRDSIRINNQPVSSDMYNTIRREIEATCHQVFGDPGFNPDMSPWPSSFELMTATALLLFSRVSIDVAVVEVGLGGTLDATNVFSAPVLCVFTAISEDHTEYLGKTIKDIASHKAGILKRGASVVIGIQSRPEVTGIFTDRANKVEAGPVYAVSSPSRPIPTRRGWASVNLPVRKGLPAETISFPLTLNGPFQLENSALAVTALSVLKDCGGIFEKITNEAIVQGMGRARWPGRAEWLTVPVRPVPITLLVDGAHNMDGSRALRQYISEIKKDMTEAGTPIEKVVWVCGASQNKDLKRMMSEMVGLSDTVFCVPFPQPIGMPWVHCWKPEEIEELLKKGFPLVERHVSKSATDALEQISMKFASAEWDARSTLVIVAGSLYLMAVLYRTYNLLSR